MKKKKEIFVIVSLILLLLIIGNCSNSEKKKGSVDKEILKKMSKAAGQDSGGGNQVKIINTSNPTHFEKRSLFEELEEVVEIPAEINEKNFLVLTKYITASDQNFYAMDIRLKRIFRFKNNGDFIDAFGDTGQGPGEFDKNSWIEIYFSSDGFLNTFDNIHRRLSRFSPDGKFINDYRIHAERNYTISCFPVVSQKGDIFVRGGRTCTLDVYNIHDKDMKIKYSLFGQEYFNEAIVVDVPPKDYLAWYMSTHRNVYYDILPDDRLIVYLAHTSTVYLYNGNKLEKSFAIRPKWALDNFSRQMKGIKKKRGKNTLMLYVMAQDFFVDKDEPNYFYLRIGLKLPFMEGKKVSTLLYRFDLHGNLQKIYFYPHGNMFFNEKRNGLFYGTKIDRLFIYKPKN